MLLRVKEVQATFKLQIQRKVFLIFFMLVLDQLYIITIKVLVFKI